MRISIAGSTTLATDQVKHYAEYRVFASLARFTRRIRTASVRLEAAAAAGSPGVTCSIELDVGATEPIRCRGTNPHVIGAIDAAAEHASRALGRRAGRGVPGHLVK